jgi:hypothetical protein
MKEITGGSLHNLFDLEKIAAQQFKIRYMQQLIDLQKSVYEANKAKGFWDDAGSRNRGEAVALINGEFYESLEWHRKGKFIDERAPDYQFLVGHALNLEGKSSNEISNEEWKLLFESTIKDTFQEELADGVIRLLDYTGGFGIVLTTNLPACRQGLPANYGEAILQINAGINNTYYATKTTAYGETGWSYVLADIIDLAVREHVDLARIIEWKLRYNAMRPHKHGKNY